MKLIGVTIIIPILLSVLIVLTLGVAAAEGRLRDDISAQRSDGCCAGKRGNVNGTGAIDLGDLSALASFLTSGGYAFSCPEAANVDGVGIVDLSDLSFLVSYLTSSGFDLLDCPGIVTDIDGNVYQTVTIGTQVWMAENLKVTHYRNGDAIPGVIDSTTWVGLTTGAYCEYNNDANNVVTYGRLYNWYAVSESRNIAPRGWHVPTDAEWKQMEVSLGMSQVEADATGYRGTSEGGKAKEIGTTHWVSPNTGATNEGGFSALPGAYRNYDGNYFINMGYSAYFWSSTEHYSHSLESWYRYLSYSESQVYRNAINEKSGFSIRCVKDN